MLLLSSYCDSFKNAAESIFAICGVELVKTDVVVYLSPKRRPFAHNEN